MKRVLESHELWWDGRLKRPLVRLTLTDAYPKERHADAPLLSQASCADFTYAPEALIEALDAELSQYEFLGDSFPMVNFDAFEIGRAHV